MPAPPLRVTFLGTGTSVGIPVVTCSCDVCTSGTERNQRLRASLLLEWPNDGAGTAAKVLVDTSTDLRQQALRAGLDRVDAVVFTHAHADHILGLDELRIFNFVHRRSIPLYGTAPTLEAIQRMFAYAFDPAAIAAPRLEPNPVGDRLELHGATLELVPVQHGSMEVLAIRFGDFAYVTDCNGISAAAADRLRGLDVLVIDALRRTPHRSHFSLDEALCEIERLGPRHAYLTHLSHDFDHESLERELPGNVSVAYDGLQLEIPASGAGA